MIVVNRLLGLILGLALLMGGVIVAVEATLGLMGRDAWLIDRALLDRELTTLTWSDRRVLPVAIGLLVAGIVLVLVELKPRRPTVLPLRWSTEDRRALVERRGVEELLASVALSDHDVASARARVGRRESKVEARTLPDADEAVRDRVHRSLTGELDRLGLNSKVKVRTKPA